MELSTVREELRSLGSETYNTLLSYAKARNFASTKRVMATTRKSQQ